MISVTPKVFFLGEMKLDDDNVHDWLSHIGGEAAAECMGRMSGSDLESLVELSARRCYKSYSPGLNPNVTKVRTDSAEYHENILRSKHGSVTAHGHCTYAFEDVSRVFTHEVVRNATGNDISQESLRYVRLNDLRFWIPPIIAKDKELRNVPSRGTDTKEGWKWKRCPELIFEEVIQICEWAQKALAEYYDIDNIKDFETKKKLTSAFRRVAPIGLATGIVITFNIRSLRWIIEQRTSRHAEEEIRLVFGMVAEDAMQRWPMLFQDFGKVDSGDGMFEYVPKYSKI